MANRPSEIGREIVETIKDHMVRVLAGAPEDGWTAVRWADEAGLLVEPSSFPAALVHHLAPILVREGRARQLGEAGLASYVAAAGAVHAGREPGPLPVAEAPALAPHLWSDAPGTDDGQVEIERRGEVDGLGGSFPEGSADEGADRPPEGHGGPWIP